MEIKYLSTAPLSSKANLLAIPVSGDPTKDAFIKAVDKKLGGQLLKQAKAEGFVGKLGQSCVCLLYTSPSPRDS